jgi:hypothetical protein
MPGSVVLLLIVCVLAGSATPVLAQSESRGSRPRVVAPPPANGLIQGTIRDEAGTAIGGAIVLALGPSLSSATSDASGRFVLPLAPGEYVLRATREGYQSTYRESIRIHTSATIERDIRLTRQRLLADGRPASTDSTAGLTEAAWRLRQLPPSVLRDHGAAAGDADPRPAARTVGQLFWADLTGQVNYFAASRMPGAGTPDANWSASRDADLSFGAPIGRAGDWAVRSVMDATSLASWAVQGEFHSRDDGAHAFTIGVSYSAQALVAPGAPRTMSPGLLRSVGGGYGFDRWRIAPRLEIDYGLRVDRHDYLDEGALPSANIGVRAEAISRTFVRVALSQRHVAPGADEFLAPDARGEWVPSSTTFAPLRGEMFTPERVRHAEVGVARQFGRGDSATTVEVRRFRGSTRDQIAAVFGLGRHRTGSHYVVLTPGSFDVQGWGVQLEGDIAPHVRGTVDYTVTDTRWHHDRQLRRIARLAPSVARAANERLHDVTASIAAALPGATEIAVAYRLNTAFSRSRAAGSLPGVDGRFDVNVYHVLHYQPIQGGQLEVLFALRTLARALPQAGSTYDELLTVAPPMRLLTGVRMKF